MLGVFYTELNTTIVLSAIKLPARLSQVTVIKTGENEITNNNSNAENKHRETTTKFDGRSGWMLASYEIAHICNGEFAAFVITWNLILEYIVIAALISKALIVFIDVIFYGSANHLTQLVEMPWFLSQYFDVLALFVPIVVGGKFNAERKLRFGLKWNLKLFFFLIFHKKTCSWNILAKSVQKNN